MWCPSAPVVQAILEGSPERQPEDGLVRSTSLIRGQQRHVPVPIHGVPAPGPQQSISPHGAYAQPEWRPFQKRPPENARVGFGAKTGVKRELLLYKSITYGNRPKTPASICVQNMGLRSQPMGRLQPPDPAFPLALPGAWPTRSSKPLTISACVCAAASAAARSRSSSPLRLSSSPARS